MQTHTNTLKPTQTLSKAHSITPSIPGSIPETGRLGTHAQVTGDGQ